MKTAYRKIKRSCATTPTKAPLGYVCPREPLSLFRVEYQSKESSDKDKAWGFGEFDFPVYLLGPEHDWEKVQGLMEKHRIPKTIKKEAATHAHPYQAPHRHT